MQNCGNESLKKCGAHDVKSAVISSLLKQVNELPQQVVRLRQDTSIRGSFGTQLNKNWKWWQNEFFLGFSSAKCDIPNEGNLFIKLVLLEKPKTCK